MGMGQELNKMWECERGINQDGNGNNLYYHGNWFPSTASSFCTAMCRNCKHW